MSNEKGFQSGDVPIPYWLKAKLIMQGQRALEISPWRIQKRHLRRHQLRKGEVTLLRVNTQPLKEIVDYDLFRCAPTSSVARDKAISGSDIDGAVVVTREAITLETQHAFLEELRRQGFSIYHTDDIINKAHSLFSDDQNAATSEEMFVGIISLAAMETRNITFLTHNDVRQNIASGKMDLTMAICLAGVDIK